MNTAALLAWLSVNWVKLLIAAVGGYIGWENRDKLKAVLPGAKADEATDSDGLDILEKLQNLPIVKKFEVTADDIKRTGRSAVLIKFGDWINELPEGAKKEECKKAHSVLFNAIVVDLAEPTPAK